MLSNRHWMHVVAHQQQGVINFMAKPQVQWHSPPWREKVLQSEVRDNWQPLGANVPGWSEPLEVLNIVETICRCH